MADETPAQPRTDLTCEETGALIRFLQSRDMTMFGAIQRAQPGYQYAKKMEAVVHHISTSAVREFLTQRCSREIASDETLLATLGDLSRGFLVKGTGEKNPDILILDLRAIYARAHPQKEQGEGVAR